MLATRSSGGLAVLLIPALLFPGCGSGGGGGSGDDSRLLALSFDLENRTDVRRNQPLVFTFSSRVDPDSVGFDTLQIYSGPQSNPVPFSGRYEVRDNKVTFFPTVLETDPNPLGLPLNPYGFSDNASYSVLMPGTDQLPPPLRTLETRGGKKLLRTFASSFQTSSEYLPEDPPVRPRLVRMPDDNGNALDDLFLFTRRSATGCGRTPITPVNPGDKRLELPTDTQFTLTFSEAMDPRSINPDPESPGPPPNPGGSYRLKESATNIGISGTLCISGNGREFTFVPGTPLAHATIIRQYLVTLTTQMKDLAGNPLILADVTRPNEPINLPEEGRFSTALVPGENGPLGQVNFSFVQEGQDPARDNGNTDTDVQWGGVPPNDKLSPQVPRSRSIALEPVCQPAPGPPQINCPFLLPQPLDICLGPVPNGEDCNPCTAGIPPADTGHAKGGKIQLLYLKNEVRPTSSPANSDKLPNSEAITKVEWGPISNYLFRTRYSGVTVRLGHGTGDEINGGLGFSYDGNFNAGSAPVAIFPLGDYNVPNMTNAPWFPWPQTTDFEYDGTNSLIVEVNVPDPRVNDPQATYQLFRSESTAITPYRRIFSEPNRVTAGCGERTVYHHRFSFIKKKHKAQTGWLDIGRGTVLPDYRPPVIFPPPTSLPGGTGFVIRYQGADTSSGGNFTPLSTDIRGANRKRYLRMEIVFSSNPFTLARPFIDSIGLVFGSSN